MSAAANKRRNFDGNVEDADGGSFYVVNDEGEVVAGPFGSAPYATTVRERLDGSWLGDCHVEYDPDGGDA